MVWTARFTARNSGDGALGSGQPQFRTFDWVPNRSPNPMRFTPQFLDELKARLPVSEVVGKRVKLTRSGREFKGLSPFNKEKTASFFVNDQKQAWFDFSSGKNGSIFDFLMQTDGLSFPEAVERLAQMAGMPLPKVSREDEARDARRKTLYEVMELAAKFFEANLAGRGGAKARGYLADRGLDSRVQLKHRLGYGTSERFALKEYLGNQGVPVPDMVEAGLVIAGDDIPVPYDRFRDRVMFPITDIRGRVIAFGGRALEKEAQAKYLNSPETPLFHKGATLYNIANARAAAHEGAPIFVVEGYVDVIAMVEAGYAAAVAPLGTALTEEQLALLWKMADEPTLCFDGDKAGQRAAFRAADLALPRLKPGKSLRFAMLPEGQDPDDLVRAGGRAAIEEVLAAARPLAQVLWTRETEGVAFDTPERRAALESRLNEITSQVGDESVRKYYRQDFNTRVAQFFAQPPRNNYGARNVAPFPGRDFQRGRDPRNQRFVPSRGGAQNPYGVVSQQMAASPLYLGHRTSVPRREALILQAALNHPWLLHDHLEELASLEFRHAEAEKLKSCIIDLFAHENEKGASPDPAALRTELIRQGFAATLEKISRAITTDDVWGAGPTGAPADVLVTWQQLVGLQRQSSSLLKELKDAELALSADNSDANFLRLTDVKGRLSKTEGTEALIEGFGASSGRSTKAN
jgi:DNA primase